MEPLLICNATIVNEGEITEGDVLIAGGRIEAIGRGLSTQGEVLDAAGCYLLPGMIDSQVSFCEPGMSTVADIASESGAAVAGGVTSYLDLPDPVQMTATAEQIAEKQQLAQGRSLANYGFYLNATRDNVEALAALPIDQICALHLMLGAGHGDQRLLDDPEVVAQVFENTPLLLAAHCEDMPLILEHEESYRGIYGDNIPMEFHPVIRSDEVCATSTAFALELAGKYETALHLMQVSSAQELALLSDEVFADKQITAGVSTPLLHFADTDYAEKGGLLKSIPAIKSPEDRAGLIQGLMEGRLDMVSSAHQPQLTDDKDRRSYFDTPDGMPMVQHGLLSLLENYHDGIFSLEFIAQKVSHAVAERFAIAERGFIREGYWADLVLVDTAQSHRVTPSNSLSRCGWTPFDGYRFRSVIAATLVNGQLVWQDGKLKGAEPVGRALEYQRIV